MAVARFDAFWTDDVAGGSGRLTGDPLGLRAWANRVTQVLVPGLRNGTNRVQGFGLLCAALDFARRPAGSELGTDTAFLRVERAWVLAQTERKTSLDGVPAWAGQRRARALLDGPAELLDLDVPLLARQLPTGVWGLYRRAAAAAGLLSTIGGRGTSPRQARLTESGKEVARSWWEQNVTADLATTLRPRLADGVVPVEDLRWAIRADLPPYVSVAESLTQALEDGRPNPAVAQGLTALRGVWDDERSLSPAVLRHHRSILTEHQRGVVDEARAVVRLTKLVELPYRQYLRDPQHAPRPDPGLWHDTAWQAVPLREREVGELQACLRKEPKTWLGVHRWATTLAERRSSQVIAPGTAPRTYTEASPPALALAAAEALFAQGLLGPALDDAEIRATLRRSVDVDEEGAR